MYKILPEVAYQKSISFSLGMKLPEVVPFVASIVLGVPLPLLLCLDLGTGIMTSISLAMEAKEGDIMQHKPRDPGTLKLIVVLVDIMHRGACR